MEECTRGSRPPYKGEECTSGSRPPYKGKMEECTSGSRPLCQGDALVRLQKDNETLKEQIDVLKLQVNR